MPKLPSLPGVYKFKDKEGKLIYVGKAKNLKKRVSSYFNRDLGTNKTTVMVRTASSLEFMIVNSEHDALLLENNLIKEFQPRYNVNLKDGKTYPFICIKKERFPRIFFTRKLIKDGSEYFGPYTSVNRASVLLDTIKQLFPLRTCNLFLAQKNIEQKKFKVCLEYHIGNCKGPCENLQSEEDYNSTIQQIRNLLKGHLKPVSDYLNAEMKKLSENYEFEKANLFKQKLEMLENYQHTSTVVNPSLSNIDVFAFVEDEKTAFVNYMKVVNGSIIQSKTIELHKKIEEEKTEMLQFAVNELRQQFSSASEEIIVPFFIPAPDEKIKITVPVRGDKKKLLELAEKNVAFYKLNLSLHSGNKQTPQERIMKQLQEDFRLKELPTHIECFDNSNFQGSFPVASMVVFKNAKPSKKDYRHFNIKTVEGPNDFASMEEIVYRRYKRLTEENQSLPQLVIIDGGKGQLGAAMNSIDKLGLRGKMAIAGIAKRLEEIYFPDDSLPLYINKKSEGLKVIQQIRNEAHRFAITFHREKRSKGTIKTGLEEINGVGKSTADKLLKHFRSVEKIKSASIEELISVIGKSRAEKVKLAFDTK
ncbi:MAG TPA: excinuclease ABC subunit C [Bacteroidetes bacterium]|nr:excinuclease ABC subunit C [Bacteroidota bacterium]